MYPLMFFLAAILSTAAADLFWELGFKPSGLVGLDTTKRCRLWVNEITTKNACPLILEKFELSQYEFTSWNPAVKDDCSGFDTNYSYCVNAPPPPPPSSSTKTQSTHISTTLTTPSSRSSTLVPTVTQTGPSPTQSGVAPNCAVGIRLKRAIRALNSLES
ncbi:predicted protein [Uncinocarpus reesii 1704]|uniref:LysM domain-containing protein n=1 Tax=Uncinocarpus reesii (strain UAMH 1704) TaxID=336963 RepID=C4JNM8_UNCRE|nr:uncharacterized protein UREG_03026 [Uncinocarpus reesii 1704]EEP78181.1 predicted protein [Uncinocarpus reesii 1704]